MSKQGLTTLEPDSWKSVCVQKLSQTSAIDWGGSHEVRTGLKSLGTRILEVCERSELVTDRCNGLGRVPGDQISDLHD